MSESASCTGEGAMADAEIQIRHRNLLHQTGLVVLKLCMLMKEGRLLRPTAFSYSYVPHSEQISLNFFIFDKFLQHHEQALMLHSEGGSKKTEFEFTFSVTHHSGSWTVTLGDFSTGVYHAIRIPHRTLTQQTLCFGPSLVARDSKTPVVAVSLATVWQ